MCACSHNKTPLQRSGTSQQQRLLPGLNAGYVQVDERTNADRIIFASEMSAWLKYFNLSNTATNNWAPFFQNDVSAVLALVAIQDADAYRRLIKSRFSLLQSDEHQADTPLLQETLGALFSSLLTLASCWDLIMARLPDEITLKQNVRNIKMKLAPSLQRLLSYYKGAQSLTLITENDEPGVNIMGQPFTKAGVIIAQGLQQEWWGQSATSWTDYYNTKVTADVSIFGTDPDTYRRINHAANHNLFTAIFDQFLLSYVQIVKDAKTSLENTLENWDTHQPHYSLFLAFLKLFHFSKAHINTLTQQHLDFYYKEVLRLVPKKAVPDQAHIIAELARPVNDRLVRKGTLFKAGKDSAGKDLIYALNEDVVFNKAQVAHLMSLYKGAAKDKVGATENKGRLFAAPVINSADGLGKALTTARKDWHPYVNKQFNGEGLLQAINMPRADIGFAIASHYLYLTEGNRTVTVKLATSNDNALATINADCYLTTAKEWLKVEGVAVSKALLSDSTPCVQFVFTLGGDAPAIVDYNPKVHGGVFTRLLPVLKVSLRHTDNVLYQYDLLKNITLKKVEIEVSVGENSIDGLKQLQLSSDFGVLDASKPFQPFGAMPSKDASLIIGNREVFTKKNAKIELNITWADMPYLEDQIAYGPTPQVTLSLLEDGNWKGQLYNQKLFNGAAATVTLPAADEALINTSIVPYTAPYGVYSTASKAGFARITLQSGFGHKAYQQAMALYLIKLANETWKASDPIPQEPYTPVIQSLHLNYTASTGVNFIGNDKIFTTHEIHFFSIYPFGALEQEQQVLPGGSLYLLPQFSHEKDGDKLTHAAEFYIGLSGLSPQQTVSILFQVLEGTTDPLVLKPADHIHWSYLSNNEWKPFDKLAVRDATRQLITSGIISFDLPADATLGHLLLPTGYIWLRAAISVPPPPLQETVSAVCKVLTATAQAALVTFQDQDNAPDFLDTALPADTISKLQEPDTAIRKISQPYSSFGGRPRESSDHFYIRVSERLRHKSRPITIWDYERLVLEAFPQIHKVKCLNHTKITQDDYNEVAPGYVSVITIPDLNNRNDTDPLRPYTNLNVLDEITAFLKKKTSCHVKVAAHNPQFEEVRMELHIKVFRGLDAQAMATQLKEEITRYLTPWAYSGATDIQFGGKIYKSSLINFIEERSYIDYITNVQLYHKPGQEAPESGDLDEITAATARSILVSAVSNKHVVHIIEDIPVEEEATCKS